MSQVSTRITIERDKRGGKPCIRGLRITVWDVLGWLGAGMTEEQILDEHPISRRQTFRPSISLPQKPAARPISSEPAFGREPVSTPRSTVRDVGLKQSPEPGIWEWAKENGFTVVTTDSDFVAIAKRLGWPPKVGLVAVRDEAR